MDKIVTKEALQQIVEALNAEMPLTSGLVVDMTIYKSGNTIYEEDVQKLKNCIAVKVDKGNGPIYLPKIAFGTEAFWNSVSTLNIGVAFGSVVMSGDTISKCDIYYCRQYSGNSYVWENHVV